MHWFYAQLYIPFLKTNIPEKILHFSSQEFVLLERSFLKFSAFREKYDLCRSHQGTMVLGLKDKLIYGVISGLIPLLELCTKISTIHVKGTWYQVYHL
jgi:hypothetical protein